MSEQIMVIDLGFIDVISKMLEKPVGDSNVTWGLVLVILLFAYIVSRS